ncbi:MAG: DUF2339 domain-containing protein, partial [Gaiellaceae bacterium]
IAAAATVVAVSWKAELVAALGLIGALLVPLMTVVEEGEFTLIGTAFAAVVLAATAAVALHERWRVLLVAGIAASFLQIAGLVAQSAATEWAVVWLTALFWALYLAVAAIVQLTSKARVDPLAATLALAAAALAASSAAQLFDGEVGGWRQEGLALLAVAAGYLALGAVFLRRLRDFSTLLWAVGLTVLAVAAAELLSGAWLAVAWAGEAAVLAWLGEATRERRFRLASAAYLALALSFTLGHEAPVTDLLELSVHPAIGVPSVLAVAAAALVVAWFSRRAPEERTARSVAVWLAGALVLYAASLGILELAELVSTAGVDVDFQRGHTAVSAAWGAIGLGLLTLGLVRRSRGIRLAGFALYGVSLAKLFLYDLTYTSPMGRPLSFLAVGILLLASGFFYQRLSERLEERDRGGPKTA